MVNNLILETLAILCSKFVVFTVRAIVEKLIRDYMKENNK